MSFTLLIGEPAYHCGRYDKHIHQRIETILETKTKLKSKWSELPLFWQSTYEFVAPYDFDECIRRINDLGSKYWDERSSFWNRYSEDFGIDSQQDNGGVFNFWMSGKTNKVMLKAQLYGQLIYKNESQTQNKVRVGFTKSSTAFLIFALLIICIVGFVVFDNTAYRPLGIFGISGAFLLFQIILGYSLKVQLYHNLHDALTKNIPPSETSAN